MKFKSTDIKIFEWQNSLWFLLFILICIFIVFPGILLIESIPFTTNTLDQYAYLQMGKEGLYSGLFIERSPVYSLWISFLCKLITEDLIVLFYREKIIATILLSILIGFLGSRVFGRWTALLFFAWTWQCKYLLLETNGSHTMACIFLVLAFIFMSFKNGVVAQVYILMLFLSAMCRVEMWGVLGLFVLTDAVFKYRNNKDLFTFSKLLQSKIYQAALGFTLLGIILLLFFKTRASYQESHRFSLAFMQTFTVNYIEQHQLAHQYPDKWNAGIAVLKDHFTEAKSPMQLILNYPRAIGEHLQYNLRYTYQIPAITFGFVNFPLMVVLIIVWLTQSYFRKNHAFQLNTSQKILMASTLLLIPISILLKVSMRYYIQLIPVMMLYFGLAFQVIMKKLTYRVD